MNARCTHCGSVFRVDPAKVPPAGVRARCSVCSNAFWVRLEISQPAPVAPTPAALTPAAPTPAAPMPSFAGPAVSPGRPPPPTAPGGPIGGAPLAPSAPPAPAIAPSSPHPPPPATAVGAGAAPSRGRRTVNPFLSQDPEAKARRLARALVSDIVVYHPAKRRDGLRDGSLKLLFEEEIRKSWEEYVDQVGRELAEATNHFTDALNEILADGQPVFP